MFWTERCNLFFNRGGSLTEERWVFGLCTCEQANVLLYLSFYFYCISISIVFVFLLYLYFCDREKLSGPGLDMRETNHPLVLLCTGVTLMVSCTSCDHASFSPCTWIHVFLFFGTHQPQMADGPWREVGGCQEQWHPLTTRQPFLLCDLRGGWDGVWAVGGSTLVLVAMHMYMEGGRCTPAHSEQTRIRATWLWKGLIRY